MPTPAARLRATWTYQRLQLQEILASGHNDDGAPLTPSGRAMLESDIAELTERLGETP